MDWTGTGPSPACWKVDAQPPESWHCGVWCALYAWVTNWLLIHLSEWMGDC